LAVALHAAHGPVWRLGAGADGGSSPAGRPSRFRGSPRALRQGEQMTAAKSHRLDGLQPDNHLAYLASPGLLRALEAADRPLCPRAAWDLDQPPLRPRLYLASTIGSDEVAELAARGVEVLAESHEFGGRKDLNYSRGESRDVLKQESLRATK